MKRFLIAAASLLSLTAAPMLVLTSLAPPASAATDPVLPETGYTFPFTNGAVLAATQISTNGAVFNVTGKQNLAVQVQSTGADASSTNIQTYTFQQSADGTGTVWTTWRTLIVTGLGTLTTGTMSNSWTLGGIRRVRLFTINNATLGASPTNTTSVHGAVN